MSDFDTFDQVMVWITVAIIVIVVYVLIKEGIYCVSEKEVIVVERFGEFDKVMTAGIHFILPIVYRKKVRCPRSRKTIRV